MINITMLLENRWSYWIKRKLIWRVDLTRQEGSYKIWRKKAEGLQIKKKGRPRGSKNYKSKFMSFRILRSRCVKQNKKWVSNFKNWGKVFVANIARSKWRIQSQTSHVVIHTASSVKKVMINSVLNVQD